MYFDWGNGSPDPAIGPDQFSVRWVGQVQPRYSETYTFYTVSDDGVRLWVNNQLRMDNWTDHGPTENAGLIALQAGALYDLKMEMYENGGGATAQLFWSSPSVAKEVIPSTQLYPPLGSNIPPVVTLTSPTTGAVFVASSPVTLAADATDPDGAVLQVSFLAGDLLLGTASASPFTLTWPNPTAGIFALRAVATDDSGLTRISAPVTIFIAAGLTTNLTLIPIGAVWKYRDTGENLGDGWTALAFNDSAWASGPAMLGYGDANGQWPRTTNSYGPDGKSFPVKLHPFGFASNSTG